MSKKVAIVVSTYPPYSGGMGNVAETQARLLREKGFDVSVYTPKYKTTLKVDGLNQLPAILKYGNAAWLPQIKNKVKQAHIVFLHYPFFGVAEIFSLCGVRKKQKLVVYYHMDNVGQGLWRIIFYIYHKLFLGLLIKKADAVMVSTKDYAKESLLKTYLQKWPNKFYEVPLSVDVNKYFPGVKLAELTAKYSLDINTPVAIFVGGLDSAHYFKGVENLIIAWQKVCFKIENAKLFIIGEGDRRHFYEQSAKKFNLSDKIVFCGFVPSLIEYYRLADVFVLSSVDRSEAFGLVILEAMASGCPIVASNLAGVRAVVKEGETGYLVDPKNLNDLSEKLIKILENKDVRFRFSQKSRDIAVTNYSEEKVGNALAQILSNL